jgi:hypothetical protein
MIFALMICPIVKWSNMCKLYLFGAPALECSGHPQPIPRRKAMALLAYLAVTQQSHSREALAALLWPDMIARSGRSDLSRMLSCLRKTLGSGYFLTDRESVALNRDVDLWVDVLHFRQQLEACRKTADWTMIAAKNWPARWSSIKRTSWLVLPCQTVLILMSGSCCKPKPYAAIWVGP